MGLFNFNPPQSNQTTTTQSPPWQTGYQNYGLNQAYSQYQGGGTPVVGFSPMQEQALQGYQNMGGNNPLTQAATNYSTNVLNGGAFNNPYLNSTFNQAAQATQNQLASQYGTAGSNVLNSMPVRSQQLNNLATDIYGGAYNTGVSQQMNALNQAPGTQGMGYQDLSQLYGAGQQVQNLGQQYANQPANSLNQYMNQVGPNMGQQQTTPMYYNQGAGALGGALAGSSLAQQYGWPSWLGALMGGIVGG
jgi:hypothetical protein